MSILTQGGAAGGGSTTDLASPGAIGGTTPAAITGTTITANTKFSAAAHGSASAPVVNFGAAGINYGLFSAAGQVSMSVNGSELTRWATGSLMYVFGNVVVATGQVLALGTSQDTTLTRGGVGNSVCFGPTTNAAGGATTRVEINKAVTGIADNTATATFTVTVPNGAHSAALKVTLVGSLGAGGAIGANEASASIAYDICVARTAGVNAVATIATADGSTGSTAVAGAATCTVTAALSAISGAVGATNTFTVNVTIARGSGSSANHTCLCYGVLLNANASGVTIA